MTEQEWLTNGAPLTMLQFLEGRTTDRKLRLFACACGRQAWNPFVPRFAVRATAAAEAFADGKIDPAALARVYELARRAIAAIAPDRTADPGYLPHVLYAAMCAVTPDARRGADAAARAAVRAAVDAPFGGSIQVPNLPGAREELAAQADLLRDIFGNPFREVAFDPAWRTSDALALANAMYSNRDIGAMPILADALQEAGCDDEDVLSHCREPREHVRGCWVVDLLLGK